MKIVVLVAYVPDTETRIKVGSDGRSIDTADVKWILNPFDEYAVEQALQLVEAASEGEVTVVTLGDDRAQPVLRQCLAMGAHRAVLINEPAIERVDGLSTARALAAAVKRGDYDLVLAGKQGVGHDRSQVGVMVAELLDIPHVAVVTSLTIENGKMTCKREIEGGQEVVESSLPALVTAQKGLNEPRYASLKGIMAAKKKPLDVLSGSDLGEAAGAGAAESWTHLEPPPARSAGQILNGDPKQVAAELVRKLSQEAGVI